MQPSAQKFASLQIVRAVAAWMVVFHHYMQIFFEFKSESALGAFFSQYGSVGVDVFFVLSGFVMCLVAKNSNKEPASFLVNRIFRLAPNYWFHSALVIICISVFPSGFFYTDFNLKSLIASALFLPSWNPSGLGMYPLLTAGWTLNFEMFFYVALACCMAVNSRHFLHILFVVFAILPLVYPRNMFFSHIAGSFALYEFLAGGLLAMAWTGHAGTLIRLHHRPALAGTVACFIIGTLLFLLRGSTLLFASSIVALAVLCERYTPSENRIVRGLVRLGDQSYSTYLAHCVVLGIAYHFGGKNLGQAAQLATLAGIILGIYVMSSQSYRWLERNDSLERMRKALVSRVSARTRPQTIAPEVT